MNTFLAYVILSKLLENVRKIIVPCLINIFLEKEILAGPELRILKKHLISLKRVGRVQLKILTAVL